MAGLDRITEHALAPGTENGADLRKDVRLMIQRDAVMNGFTQGPGGLQPTRMAQAGRPVGGVIRQRVEKEVAWHISFL